MLASCEAMVLKIGSKTFLDQLRHYSDVRLVVRAGGVTLFRRTRFGIFRVPDAEASDTLHDPRTGLRILPRHIRRICHLAGGSIPPCFEIEFAGIGFSVAIFPGNGSGDRRCTARLLSPCDGHSVPLAALRSRGAGAWLDEGLFSHGNHWRNQIQLVGSQGGNVRLGLCSPALEVACRMKLSSVDHDGSVWRLSDSSAGTVVHLDPRHPAIDADDAIRFSDELPALNFSGLSQTRLPHEPAPHY
ncbi:MAG: hypothetical protein WD342_12305 [Verrucomicrobiales bacterium]